MRSTLIHYQLSEFALLESKWFDHDALRMHDFPEEYAGDLSGSRVVERVNWTQTFARRGLNFENFRKGLGSTPKDEYQFFRKRASDSSLDSLPEVQVLTRSGPSGLALQGDLVMYQEMEFGLFMEPCLTITNGVQLKYLREAKARKLWRHWLKRPTDIDKLSRAMTPKHAAQWASHHASVWDATRSVVYLTYQD